MRYAHLAPGHMEDAVNRGSLFRTVTRLESAAPARNESSAEMSTGKEEKEWLGDEDSNLGRQIQSLSSYH